MTRIVAGLLLLITPNILYAQKCENRIDSFTNEPSSTFEWKRGGIRNLYFESTSDVILFEFAATATGAIEYTVPKGAEILIKLENGEILKLQSIQETRSSPASLTIDESNNVTYSLYYLRMELTRDQLEKLGRFKLTDLRYPDLHGGSRSLDDKELGNRWQRNVQDGANCLLRKQ